MILNGEVTKNGRKYNPETLESIKDQINSRDKSMNIGQLGYPEGFDINLRNAAFTYSNAIVENGILYADIEILKTMMGDEVKRLLELGTSPSSKGIVFRPAGVGNVESQNINDYKLLGIHIILLGDDAIKKILK